MSVRLIRNNYGKSRVRMMKVIRHAVHHDLIDLTVSIALEGDFETAHSKGDNSHLIATDTMKNMVYALANEHFIESIEAFAACLGQRMLQAGKHVTQATVEIAQNDWNPIPRFDKVGQTKSRPHPTAFQRGYDERQTCSVVVTRHGERMSSGLDRLVVLKTADSAFEGYVKDQYTTLKETDDRLMGTSLTAIWSYGDTKPDFNACRTVIRHALISMFADHKSLSVQHTLHAMGEQALLECKQIDRISLSMPNKHCILVDLSPFGMHNKNVVFMPIDEPHGLIEAVMERT